MFYTLMKELVLLAKEKGIKHSINYLLLGISNRLELTHVYGQPTFIHIEPTTYCNSKCIMCWRTAIYESGDIKPKHMRFKDFKKILLKFPYCEIINLQGLGEPLLNPDLFKMIKFCKKRGIWVSFTTNATLLSEDISKKLILSGLDGIEFSIDGATAKTFEKIRKGSKFLTVIKNVKQFVESKNELCSEKPQIRIKTIISEANFNEIPKLLKLTACRLSGS